MSAKKWVKRFFFFVLTACSIVGAFNFVADPNGIFDVVNVRGFNFDKSKHVSDRISRFYYCNRFEPNTLLLGTSRIGTTHPHDVEAYTKDRVYNLSLAGSMIYEQNAYFQYMVKHHDIRTVVIGLDFFSYLPNKLFSEGYSDERLREGIYLKDYTDSLFSMKLFTRSYKMIYENMTNQPVETDFTNGWNTFVVLENRLPKEGEKLRTEGSKQSLEGYAKDHFANAAFREANTTLAYMPYLKALLDEAKAKNVKVIAYISPVHATHFDLIYACRLGETFEQWKREIAKLTPYYDFTGYNSVTTDLGWWWDASHISREGSKLVLARVFDDKNVTVPSDFGQFVTPRNVEEHIKTLRAQVKAENIAAVKKLIGQK